MLKPITAHHLRSFPAPDCAQWLTFAKESQRRDVTHNKRAAFGEPTGIIRPLFAGVKEETAYPGLPASSPYSSLYPPAECPLSSERSPFLTTPITSSSRCSNSASVSEAYRSAPSLASAASASAAAMVRRATDSAALAISC